MSNETKWTPGPWEEVAPADDIWPPRVFAGSKIICMADNSDMTYDEKRANANLIAAAPELFDACLDLLAWHDALADPQWHGSPSQTKAIAALAKARGELR